MSTADSSIADMLQQFEAVRSSWEEQWMKQMEASAPPPFAELFRALTSSLVADQHTLRELQARFYCSYWALWQETLLQPPRTGPVEDDDKDPRFSAPEWREIAWFSFLRRSHRLATRWLNELVDIVHADAPTERKLRFYAKQYADATAPSNFVATNPEVIKLALTTQGKSLAQGMKNLQADADKGRVSMTDESAFEVGRNLAVTPGSVVYRNELIELIQYRPSTSTVYSRPLLIVPPFINKYYILDLQPANSFVRHAIDGGLTVFVVSWRNIPGSLGHLTWDDYIERGAIAAIDAVRTITRRDQVNTLGFCVGGTLLACALAVLDIRKARPAASLTLLAAMLDFADTGDISVYVDRSYVARCERELNHGGILSGSRLAAAFASLRPNDLVWRYVVNNYLKGRTPPAFDLLYWNADSSNLPGPLYAYYVRHMYLENALREPGRLTMTGVPVDLGSIDLPTYVVAAAEDHIVPWRTAYASAMLLGSRVTFVRAASGHIAGVISAPGQPRRSFRTAPIQDSAERWLAASSEQQGSWWPHWIAWIAQHSGRRVRAPKALGSGDYPELEAAPGSYVKERLQ